MGNCFSQEKISCETEGFTYNEDLSGYFIAMIKSQSHPERVVMGPMRLCIDVDALDSD